MTYGRGQSISFNGVTLGCEPHSRAGDTIRSISEHASDFMLLKKMHFSLFYHFRKEKEQEVGCVYVRSGGGEYDQNIWYKILKKINTNLKKKFSINKNTLGAHRDRTTKQRTSMGLT